jgi:hypothetical protein
LQTQGLQGLVQFGGTFYVLGHQRKQVGVEGHPQRPVLLQQPEDNHPQAEQQADRRDTDHQQLRQAKQHPEQGQACG